MTSWNFLVRPSIATFIFYIPMTISLWYQMCQVASNVSGGIKCVRWHLPSENKTARTNAIFTHTETNVWKLQ